MVFAGAEDGPGLEATPCRILRDAGPSGHQISVVSLQLSGLSCYARSENSRQLSGVRSPRPGRLVRWWWLGREGKQNSIPSALCLFRTGVLFEVSDLLWMLLDSGPCLHGFGCSQMQRQRRKDKQRWLSLLAVAESHLSSSSLSTRGMRIHRAEERREFHQADGDGFGCSALLSFLGGLAGAGSCQARGPGGRKAEPSHSRTWHLLAPMFREPAQRGPAVKACLSFAGIGQAGISPKDVGELGGCSSTRKVIVDQVLQARRSRTPEGCRKNTYTVHCFTERLLEGATLA